MNKVLEAVTNKFIELFVALHSTTDYFKIVGAEACMIGNFSRVTNINEVCLKLQTLEINIKAAVNNFDAKYALHTLQKRVFTKRIIIAPENKADVSG